MKFPYGSPFGEPGARWQQLAVLRELLWTLQRAEEPGTLVEPPWKWRRTRFEPFELSSIVLG